MNRERGGLVREHTCLEEEEEAAAEAAAATKTPNPGERACLLTFSYS